MEMNDMNNLDRLRQFRENIQNFYPNISNLDFLHPFPCEKMIQCCRCKWIFPAGRYYMMQRCPGCQPKELSSAVVLPNTSTIQVVETDETTDPDLSMGDKKSVIDKSKVLGCILNSPATIEYDTFKFIAKSLIVQKNNVVDWNRNFISGVLKMFKKEFNGIRNISSPFSKKVIQHLFYGSYNQQTTLGESAINIQLNLKYFQLIQPKMSPLTDYQLNQVMGNMKNSPNWSDVKIIESQRVDVLTALNKVMSRTFHFGFKKFVHSHHDEVLMSLFDAQPICREVVICVRLLIKKMKCGNADWMRHFNGYIISLLVLFYFQIRGELPAVKMMQIGQNIICDGYSVGFNKPENVRICSDSLRDILFNFFEFYSNFEFEYKVISPFKARYMDKNFMDPTNSLVQWFHYEPPYSWFSSLFCIQDIFAHDINVAYSIDSVDVRDFKHLCSTVLNGLQVMGPHFANE